MQLTRREALGAGGLALAATAALGGTAWAEGGDFDIDAAFAGFMAGPGAGAGDGGGAVTFTGSDPILRSHFRIGASMALPAMAAAVAAAAIWKERTGEGQDVAIDLREAVYNVNPLMTPIMQMRLATGAVAPDDPVATGFTFTPTINGNLYQAPVGLGNPFSFVPFRTKDGRFMNITAAYPHLNTRALELLAVRAGPGSRSRRRWRTGTARSWRRRCSRAAPSASCTARTEEWLAHPGGRAISPRPTSSRSARSQTATRCRGARPDPPLSGIKALTLTHVIAGLDRGANAVGIRRRGAAHHARPVVRARGDLDRRQRRHALGQPRS